MEYNYLVWISLTIWGIGFLTLFLLKNRYWAYISIFVSAFLIRFFVAQQDDFLHSWDERYHALVAKNLVNHPLVPTLKDDPVMPYDNLNWQKSHIWLHKQPGFLYPMAISIAVFGNNEFGVRFPSMLMGAILAIVIFRMGLICFERKTAYLAAGLFAFSFFQLEQTAGVIGMDHNDVAFSFYFIISVWLYLEYRINKDHRYIYLIALFTGLATLTKWLPGLAIYGVWAFDLAMGFQGERIRQFRYLVQSFLASLFLWGGAQVYILLRWPEEAKFEYQFNRRHLTEALEGHTGGWDYHLLLFDEQYGNYAVIFLIIGLVYFVLRKGQNSVKTAFILIPLTTYVVFSLAATKSFAYVFYIAPIIFLLIAYGIVLCLELITREIKNPNFLIAISVCVFLFLCVAQLSTKKLYHAHVLGRSEYVINYWNVLAHNASIYKKLDSVAADCDIVFNCRNMQDIDAEFYSSKIVYSWCPDSLVLDSLLSKGYRIGAFEGFDSQQLEEYITGDPRIKIIPLHQMTEH